MGFLGCFASGVALQAAGLLVITLVLVECARRLFFHPLSKFPGPWLNALSDLPEAYHLARGRQHSYHRELHEKYGPAVRIAPNELAFCSAKAWEDIYGNKPGKPDMEKSPLAAGGLPPGMKVRAMTLASWEDHTRQRKAFAYPFSNTALLQQEPLIRGWVDKFVAGLGRFADEGKAANISAWFSYTTFDIIGDLCFDEPFGCLEAGKLTEWCHNIVNIGAAGTFEQVTRRLAGVGTWLQGRLVKWFVPSFYGAWRAKHFALSAEKTKRRIADKDKEHKDFIYYILKNNEAKSLLSELEMIMNSALFIAAGSDTTATALTGWMYLILTNEAASKKLVAEIRGAFRSHEEITWNGAKDLPYLGACISEAMRVIPPVPGNLNRVTPRGGAFIDGKWVAGEFAPERWLDSERDKFPLHMKEASQPFLYGPRACIGRNLSYIEQRLIMCHLLWHFDVELATDASHASVNKVWSLEGDMRHMRSYLIWMKPELWVQLKRVAR